MLIEHMSSNCICVLLKGNINGLNKNCMYSSSDGVYRSKDGEIAFPPIPTHPISAEDAKKFLWFVLFVTS